MRKRLSLTHPGAASLLTVFAVLCLTVFALLALSTARRGEALAENTDRAVQQYYDAQNRAQRILARIRGGQQPEGVQRRGDIYQYACPVSDTQTLAVTVRVTGETYTLLRWQTLSTDQWQADDSLPVWDGK